MTTEHEQALGEVLQGFVRRARPPRRRTIREFAEREIVVPNGPYPNRLFKCDRLPWTGHWFDAIDSGRWQRFALVKPSQAGGTLCGLVIPTLYHLFEIGETVVVGLPSIEMAQDKWEQDLKPVVERSRFRDLIPTRGRGSRGGRFESITFANGATLKFISGGGDDKKKAGFTARVIVITEVDGLDEAGETSREADPVTQMEARARAFGDRRRVYLECTASIERGRIWQEYATRGTASQLVLRCPDCRSWVSPDREELVGWQGTETDFDARDHGRVSCCACGLLWSEEQRAEANRDSRLVHRGEEIDADGEQHGSPPRTDTFGLRVTATNNLFATSGSIAAEEWRADRLKRVYGEDSEGFENAERELRQFVWALPWIPPEFELDPLDEQRLRARVTVHRGICPVGVERVTVGADIGRHLGHWVVAGWFPNGRGVLFDYGRFEIPSVSLGLDNAVLVALRELHSTLSEGWDITDGSGQRVFDAMLVDSRYGKAGVFAFVRECESRGDRRAQPLMGFGKTTYGSPVYSRPSGKARVIREIGDEYHVKRFREEQVSVVEVNVDHWKGVLHDGLGSEMETRGAITLCRDDSEEQLASVKHLTAEKRVRDDKGHIVWKQERKNNHWLDAAVYVTVAAHRCGVRFVPDERPRGRVRMSELRRRRAGG